MWAAGLFEGEGSITIRKGRRQVTVQIRMCDRDVIERFARWAQCRTAIGHRAYGNHWKDSWVWQTGRAQDIRRILEALRPHMGERRKARIDEALDVLSRYHGSVTRLDGQPMRPLALDTA